MEGAEEMEYLLALLLILFPKADFALLVSLDELGATLDLSVAPDMPFPPLGVPADLQSAVKK